MSAGRSWVLALLLFVCIARLWLMPLPSGFWVDEMVTAFVVQHPGDPSLAVAPQVPSSIYYWLPACLERLWRAPVELRAAAIGLAVGLLAWFAPATIGGGDAITQHVLDRAMTTEAMIGGFGLRFALAPRLMPLERRAGSLRRCWCWAPRADSFLER
jgi:hypothetical protein